MNNTTTSSVANEVLHSYTYLNMRFSVAILNRSLVLSTQDCTTGKISDTRYAITFPDGLMDWNAIRNAPSFPSREYWQYRAACCVSPSTTVNGVSLDAYRLLVGAVAADHYQRYGWANIYHTLWMVNDRRYTCYCGKCAAERQSRGLPSNALVWG